MATRTAKMQKCSADCEPERASGRRSQARIHLPLPHERDARAHTYLLVSFRDELADRFVGPGQRRLVGQEHNAEVAGAGLLAKARTMNDQHVFSPAQFLYEDVIAFGNVD